MTTAYDPRASFERVRESIMERRGEVLARVENETLESVEVARKYADHLAAGGDPRKWPEPPVREGESRWSRSRLVNFKTALEEVYADWNATLGTDAIPFSPIHEEKKWRVARYALGHLGEPMLYSALGEMGGSHSKMQSDDVATILAALQQTDGRDLILRRLRIGGKVGYLLRERQAMEDAVGLDDDGKPKHRIEAMSIPLDGRKAVPS